MPKTLEDMTPQERANCVGMWCDYQPQEWNDEEPIRHLGIIREISQFEVSISIPGDDDTGIGYYLPDLIAPRFDLPRAWAPDGTPPAGEWETTVKTVGGFYPLKGTAYQRWAGKWEETNGTQ